MANGIIFLFNSPNFFLPPLGPPPHIFPNNLTSHIQNNNNNMKDEALEMKTKGPGQKKKENENPRSHSEPRKKKPEGLPKKRQKVSPPRLSLFPGVPHPPSHLNRNLPTQWKQAVKQTQAGREKKSTTNSKVVVVGLAKDTHSCLGAPGSFLPAPSQFGSQQEKTISG